MLDPTKASDQQRQPPSLGWTTLPHASYSPGLAPSDYHLFDPMKQGLRGKHYEDGEKVKNATRTWLKSNQYNFMKVDYMPL